MDAVFTERQKFRDDDGQLGEYVRVPGYDDATYGHGDPVRSAVARQPALLRVWIRMGYWELQRSVCLVVNSSDLYMIHS